MMGQSTNRRFDDVLHRILEQTLLDHKRSTRHQRGYSSSLQTMNKWLLAALAAGPAAAVVYDAVDGKFHEHEHDDPIVSYVY